MAFKKRPKKPLPISSGSNSSAHQKRIRDIAKTLRRGTLNNLGLLPAAIKTRLEGKASSIVSLDHDGFQSIVWLDKNGKQLFLKRTDDSASVNALSDVLQAMLEANAGGIENGLPEKITIELGPSDTAAGITRQLQGLHSEMAARLEFIGGASLGGKFTKLRDDLENSSGERRSKLAYKSILHLLESLITLESGADTLENTSEQLNLLEAVEALVDKARSSDGQKKDARNAALDQLGRQLAEQKSRLTDQFVSQIGSVKRTPSEVMVHFLHALQNSNKQDDQAQAMKIVERGVKDQLLAHRLTLTDTRDFLRSALGQLNTVNHGPLTRLAQTLLSQLPDPDLGQKSEPTRLQDNVYGRVLDSAIVANLVDNPPAGVKTSMLRSARAMRQLIDDSPHSDVWAKVASQLPYILETYDKRFWFTQTPALNNIATATDSLAALKQFLDNPGDNGQALVAIPYVLAKISILAQQVQRNGAVPMPGQPASSWMVAAGKNYTAISREVGRTDQLRLNLELKVKDIDPAVMQRLGLDASNPERNLRVDFNQTLHVDSEGSGINLRHQINPFVDPTMQRSMRPTLKNKPDINRIRTQNDGVRVVQPFPTQTVETALRHGLPFGSGASGTTNIMLHLMSELQARDQQIDTRDYLLGTMMFLTYDGGHSLQEALWTANQSDKSLGLGLNIGNSDKPNEFVADYLQFRQLYGTTDSGVKLEAALNYGLDQATEHFSRHSVFNDLRADA